MPKGKYLTEEERGKIKEYRKCGCTIREISMATSRSKDVISKYLSCPGEYGERKGRDRESKLSLRESRKLINVASKYGSSAPTLQNMLELSNASYRTVKSS